MKAKLMLLGALSAGLLLATACSGAASSSSADASLSLSLPSSSSQVSSSEKATSGETAPAGEVYRGEIAELGDGQITVTQLPGYNYGQPSIVFNVENTDELATGMFVEVQYNGVLTRSIPPQGTALDVSVISNQAEGVIQNGVIQAVEKTQDGYSINLMPLDEKAGPDALVVLNVPQNALEGLTEAELKEGTKISAVTMGIATASLPPQMPVQVLLPYTG